MSNKAEQLKQEILQKVREYAIVEHSPSAFVPYKTKIRYAGRVFDDRELVALVSSALDFWLTLGPYGAQFESKMREFYGSRDFVLTNSGSSANLAAITALCSKNLDGHMRPGGEVITPAVTFPTTLSPILQNGLVPVFVDC